MATVMHTIKAYLYDNLLTDNLTKRRQEPTLNGVLKFKQKINSNRLFFLFIKARLLGSK